MLLYFQTRLTILKFTRGLDDRWCYGTLSLPTAPAFVPPSQAEPRGCSGIHLSIQVGDPAIKLRLPSLAR